MPTNREVEPILEISTSLQLSIDGHPELSTRADGSLFSIFLNAQYPEIIGARHAWLDLGCGVGNMSLGAASGLKKYGATLPSRIVLVDHYNSPIDAVKELQAMSIETEFIKKDIFALELALNQSFGFIFCFYISEFFDATNDANGARAKFILTQAAKWLVLGGCLIIGPLADHSPIIKLANNYGFSCVQGRDRYYFEKKN